MSKPINKKTAEKKLKYSEEARGHARARHAHPTLAAGPSIDAYLKQRMPDNASEGTKMSAFYNDTDQNKAVAYAFNETGSHKLSKTRTTMRVKTKDELNQITVRVVEMIDGVKQGYDAKLREVFVAVDDLGKTNECIITAYPSDTHRI